MSSSEQLGFHRWAAVSRSAGGLAAAWQAALWVAGSSGQPVVSKRVPIGRGMAGTAITGSSRISSVAASDMAGSSG